MVDAAQIRIFLPAAALLAALPGPGMLYVLARSLRGGRPEGLASSFGTAAGGMVHVVAGAFGLSAILAKVVGKATGSPFPQGVVTEMLNPKTALFFLAFIPQFISARLRAPP